MIGLSEAFAFLSHGHGGGEKGLGLRKDFQPMNYLS
ncbi:hypothetical protein AXX17_AT4G38610 [Arabidopsis thaliana]|nr:hypothetical protein AXX17_AT4G38610 [Arabidopsis thaliana]